MESNINKRDYAIDFLRALGTLLVILAHVSPPFLLKEIRTFDVTMLVFISGMSLAFARYGDYVSYIKKRIKKLLIPTYVTTATIITLLFIGRKIMNSFSFTWEYIANSFLFIDNYSIGFVWIVKVYLFIAILTPLIKLLNKKIKNTVILFGVGYIIIIAVSILTPYVESNIFVREYVLYAIQYSVVALIGLRFYEQPKSGMLVVLMTIVIFAVCLIMSGEFCPSNYKYPPKTYYLSYGVLIALLLFYGEKLIFSKVRTEKLNKCIRWISKNSFAIYISHIYFMWGFFLFEKVVGHVNWIIKFTFVILGSVTITIIIRKMQTIWNEKFN